MSVCTVKPLIWLLAFAALYSANVARSENLPLPRIDEAATEVAGKPLTAHCESMPGAWGELVQTNFGEGFPGWWVVGFTKFSEPIIYLSPRVCLPLHTAFQYGYKAVLLSEFVQSVNVLVHEAVHQRGIADEAITECLANKLSLSYARKWFNIPATLWKKKVVLRNGVRTTIRVRVANPTLALFQSWLDFYHKRMPPEYQGGVC